MLLFGHRFIQNDTFYHIFDSESIINTPPASKIYIEFSEQNLDIISEIHANQISFGINVKNITQFIYAENLGAAYIMVDKSLAKTAQTLADSYLFDAKILVHITQEKDIEEMALLGIDGVIFPEAIVKVSS